MSGITQKDYADAIAVQDACNLSGVVHSFSNIVSRLWDEARVTGEGTDWVNQHPICVLFADKIASLTRVGVDDIEGYTQAYNICCKKITG